MARTTSRGWSSGVATYVRPAKIQCYWTDPACRGVGPFSRTAAFGNPTQNQRTTCRCSHGPGHEHQLPLPGAIQFRPHEEVAPGPTRSWSWPVREYLCLPMAIAGVPNLSPIQLMAAGAEDPVKDNPNQREGAWDVDLP